MNNLIIKKILKRKTISNQKALGVKTYPQSFDKIGLLCNSKKLPNAQLISKLKSTFGGHVQILIFVLLEKGEDKDIIYINYKNFDWLGNLKSISIQEELKALNIIIDMTLQYSILKNYILSIARQAFKIALGHYSQNIYHLSFDLKNNNQNLFADEIIKYHSILSHAKP